MKNFKLEALKIQERQNIIKKINNSDLDQEIKEKVIEIIQQ